jgi:hypothetical protein
MSLYYNISVRNAGYYNPPQTLFVGINPYGGNSIYGNDYGDTIYGESQDSLYSGTVGNNTIYGGGGSNTIYGDAYGLYGTVTAQSNTIWTDNPFVNDSSARNSIYGNAFVMGGDSTGGSDLYGNVVGNNVYDSYGNASWLYGNAYSMTDHAWGGHNTIEAFSVTSDVYGDAGGINGSTSYDSTHGYGVHAGDNTIWFLSPNGYAFGDAVSIQGLFYGGHNSIHIGNGNGQNVAAYGTADQLYGATECGSNVIVCDGSNNSFYTIGGDADTTAVYSNTSGGSNTIYAVSGNATIYGDCISNQGAFAGGHNVIVGNGSSNLTIYGDCLWNDSAYLGGYNTIYASAGNDTIYGDCATNIGDFSGGHNTIYAETGNVTMYGSATGGQNRFVFSPGTGVDQIGSWNSDGSVLQGFDQEGGAFNHAQGDVIDLHAYNLGGLQNLVTSATPSGDAVIYLPPAGASYAGQITLVGVHLQDLTASDFHF